MKINYDKKTDALYVRLSEETYKVSKKVTDNVLVDYSDSGKVVGIEILEASKNVSSIPKTKISVAVNT
jgi:uncharacterized protein YuzE